MIAPTAPVQPEEATVATAPTLPGIALGILAAAGFGLATAIATAMIDTPLFSREIPTTVWAWPMLIVGSLLAGALVAVSTGGRTADAGTRRGGLFGSVGMFLAVGCPVCNKIVLIALGSAGAMSWFAPVQPWLGVASVAVLAWALWRRLRTPATCPVNPPSGPTSTPRAQL